MPCAMAEPQSLTRECPRVLSISDYSSFTMDLHSQSSSRDPLTFKLGWAFSGWLPYLRPLRFVLLIPRQNNLLTPMLKQAIARLRAYIPPPTAYTSIPLSRRAAVLILLFADRRGDLRVVLTMRASTLKSCRVPFLFTFQTIIQPADLPRQRS